MKMQLFLSLFLPSLFIQGSPHETSGLKPKAVTKAFNDDLLDLNKSTKQKIEDYYSYNDMISLRGDELKKYLYDVISKDNTFVTYSKVSDWYQITDRNYELSKQIDPTTYTFSSEKADDFYLVCCYFESSANANPEKAINNKVNSYTALANSQAVDHANKTKPNGNIQVDKEHIWAKDHGFSPNGKDPQKGAGTDLHNLIAADHNTNSTAHNNYFYGEVDRDKAQTMYCYYADGTTGISGYREKVDDNYIFEPTDEWKGDIARALLYMATRYSDKKEINSQEEPYLYFSNTGSDDKEKCYGYHPNLDTYLKWNELDEVDEYERYRNDLIYKNVQNNRNPYVDYPELADIVFSKKTDYSAVKETYNLHAGMEITLPITLSNKVTDFSCTYDDSYISFDLNSMTLKALKASSNPVSLTLDFKENGIQYQIQVSFNIKERVQVESKTTLITLYQGESEKVELNYTGDIFPEEEIVFESDSDCVKIDGETITGIKKGTASVNAVLNGDGKQVLTTYSVTVNDPLKTSYNLHVGDTIRVPISENAENLKVEYDTKYFSLSSDYCSITALESCDDPLTITYTYNENGKEKRYSITFTIKDKIVLLVLKPDEGVFTSMSLITGEEYQFDIHYNGELFPDERFLFSTSDSNIATVDENGLVKANDAGECTIDIILHSENGDKVIHSVNLTVTLKEQDLLKKRQYIIIIMCCALGIILIFLVFFYLIKKSEKDKRIKNYSDKDLNKKRKRKR